jgi:hypothetical protein
VASFAVFIGVLLNIKLKPNTRRSRSFSAQGYTLAERSRKERIGGRKWNSGPPAASVLFKLRTENLCRDFYGLEVATDGELRPTLDWAILGREK